MVLDQSDVKTITQLREQVEFMKRIEKLIFLINGNTRSLSKMLIQALGASAFGASDFA